MAQLLLATVVIIAVVAWRSASARANLPRILCYTALGLLVLLVATGRVHWILGFVLAALLLLGRRSATPPDTTTTGQENDYATDAHCRLQTKNLAITIDPRSGCIDGTVHGERLHGRRLSGLTLRDLLMLHESYLEFDAEAAALLRAYLDQAHSGWRDRVRHEDAYHDPSGATALSDAQAHAVLGLPMGAERAQIVTAHRRLMQRLHPDRGGSGYLAARLNEAKAQLLRRHRTPG